MLDKIGKVARAGMALAKAKSPAIWTGIGSALYISCIPLTAHGVRKMETRKQEIDISKLTRKEKLILAGKCYWGVGLCVIGGTTCVILGQVEASKRLSAAGAMLLTTQQELAANKETVKEIIGEKKAAQVEKVQDERKAKEIIDNSEEIQTPASAAGIHFVDMLLNEHFVSSFEAVREGFIKLKEEMIVDDQASLDDLRSFTGRMAKCEIAEGLYWSYSDCREFPEPVFGEPFELNGVMRVPLRYSVLPCQFQF